MADFDALQLLLNPTPEQKAEAEEYRKKVDADKRAREEEAALRKLDECGRCGGSGYLDQFRRISGGVCFGCDGTGSRSMGRG